MPPLDLLLRQQLDGAEVATTFERTILVHRRGAFVRIAPDAITGRSASAELHVEPPKDEAAILQLVRDFLGDDQEVDEPENAPRVQPPVDGHIELVPRK